LGRSTDPTGLVVYYFSDFQRKTGCCCSAWFLPALSYCRPLARRGRHCRVDHHVGGGDAFMLPSILDGRSPVAVALTGGAIIVLVVLFVAHGFNARTATAAVGTLVSLAFVGGLSELAVHLTHLTGLSNEEATYGRTLPQRQPSRPVARWDHHRLAGCAQRHDRDAGVAVWEFTAPGRRSPCAPCTRRACV